MTIFENKLKTERKQGYSNLPFSCPPCWDVGSLSYEHQFNTSDEGAVVNMESTYYNLLAPASYGGLSKFKLKGYAEKQAREWLQSQDTYTLHKPTR